MVQLSTFPPSFAVSYYLWDFYSPRVLFTWVTCYTFKNVYIISFPFVITTHLRIFFFSKDVYSGNISMLGPDRGLFFFVLPNFTILNLILPYLTILKHFPYYQILILQLCINASIVLIVLSIFLLKCIILI